MRTTLVIQDDLLAEAKALAARRQSNVSAIVNEALRARLRAECEGRPVAKFRMLTYGEAGAGADMLPDEMARLVAEDDFERYGTK